MAGIFQKYIAKSVLSCIKTCSEFALEKQFLKWWCIGLVYLIIDVDHIIVLGEVKDSFRSSGQVYLHLHELEVAPQV